MRLHYYGWARNMRIYHVYDPATGEIYYSAPDYRAAVEVRDAANTAKHRGVHWQLGSTVADDSGLIDGSPWYDARTYQFDPEADRRLAPVEGPYRDEIIKQKAVEKNVRNLRSRGTNDAGTGGRIRNVSSRSNGTISDGDYSGFGI